MKKTDLTIKEAFEQRKGFTMYRSYIKAASILDDKDELELYRAIFKKQFENKEPELEGQAKDIYEVIEHSIETQVVGYLNSLKKNHNLVANDTPGRVPTTNSNSNSNRNNKNNEQLIMNNEQWSMNNTYSPAPESLNYEDEYETVKEEDKSGTKEVDYMDRFSSGSIEPGSYASDEAGSDRSNASLVQRPYGLGSYASDEAGSSLSADEIAEMMDRNNDTPF